MDPPVLLNECHIFILAQHEASLKWRGPYYYCGSAILEPRTGLQNKRTQDGQGPPEAYLSRWRVNSGDLDVPEFITR